MTIRTAEFYEKNNLLQPKYPARAQVLNKYATLFERARKNRAKTGAAFQRGLWEKYARQAIIVEVFDNNLSFDPAVRRWAHKVQGLYAASDLDDSIFEY